MAKHTREQLKKLLTFLDKEIIHEPANRWFVDELYKRLPQKPLPTQESPSFKIIEKYLGLDYVIDKEYSPCDYSFLDEFLQIKAESDFREMKRFQLGLRGHQINFAEFCRYAILQAELILNFFYTDYYLDKGGFTKALEDITKQQNAKKTDSHTGKGHKYTQIEDIPFSTKLWAFSKQYMYKSEVLDFARLLRNSLSHRSAQPDKEQLHYLHNKLTTEYEIKLKDDGSVPFIDCELLYNPDIKQYKYELFCQQQPFNKVEASLKELVDKIYALLRE